MRDDTWLFTETEIVSECPKMCRGGVLEDKNGEVCLRLVDELTPLDDGRWRVERAWMRPVHQPFDPLLYGRASDESSKQA